MNFGDGLAKQALHVARVPETLAQYPYSLQNSQHVAPLASLRRFAPNKRVRPSSLH